MKPHSTEQVVNPRVRLGCLLVVGELGNNPTVVPQFRSFVLCCPFSQNARQTLSEYEQAPPTVILGIRRERSTTPRARIRPCMQYIQSEYDTAISDRPQADD